MNFTRITKDNVEALTGFQNLKVESQKNTEKKIDDFPNKQQKNIDNYKHITYIS